MSKYLKLVKTLLDSIYVYNNQCFHDLILHVTSNRSLLFLLKTGDFIIMKI